MIGNISRYASIPNFFNSRLQVEHLHNVSLLLAAMIEFDQTSLSLSDFDRCSSTESFSECSLTLSPKLLPYCNDLDTFERCHNIGFSGNCKHFQPEPGVDLSQYGIKYDIKCNTDEEICSNGAGLSGATRVGTEPDCKAYVVFCGRTTGVFRSWSVWHTFSASTFLTINLHQDLSCLPNQEFPWREIDWILNLVRC